MGDKITTSKGPQAIEKDPLEVHPGDDITTRDKATPSSSADPTATPAGVAPEATLKIDGTGGDLDWDSVNTRFLEASGLNTSAFKGTISLTVGETTDEDIDKLEEQTTEDGGDAGVGRAIGAAAKAMGLVAAVKIVKDKKDKF